MKKVELLAPAGNYEGFLGAVHAGADAVYLGGEKFGARAYADNFTEEEVCRAIRYAHIYGRKVYLTLNTLIKEREFGEIYDYLLPFCRSGLDGVIIQDLGVMRAVGEWFPGLERHISTQMTVTGEYGAALLKEMGATRIVPARELSLEEIRRIKEKTEIEIETFVHGAICYCYSGQCLFSSIVGGRSGNRGRCAQPCRLPYRIGRDGEKNGGDTYPLSLKDMCTITLLPELIDAGIDSFKIEGRMKSPEYTAGVTAVYRKYIDRCCHGGEKPYKVEEQDMELLRTLYMRSEISEGYYHRHNGREMITLKNPGYAGRDEGLAAQIREKYVEGDFRLPVSGTAVLRAGEKAELAITCGSITVTAAGGCVQPALKQPLTEENVHKQLKKSGGTPFFFQELCLDMAPDIFLPVKELNDLRRRAFDLLEERLLEENSFSGMEAGSLLPGNRKTDMPEAKIPEAKIPEVKIPETKTQAAKMSETDWPDRIHVSVLTKEQYRAARAAGADRIYISSDLCAEPSWLEEAEKAEKTEKKDRTQRYLALPYIIRKRDENYLCQMEKLLQTGFFSGVLVRNLEEVRWFQEIPGVKKGRMVSDAGLYLWNAEACKALTQFCKEQIDQEQIAPEQIFREQIAPEQFVPWELNFHELRDLLEHTDASRFGISVYGRIPMMITANCVAATEGNCRGQEKKGGEGAFSSLTDRYHNTFPVYLNCVHCYNVIYNTVPLSLHQQMEKIKKTGIHTFRLDFTTENGNDVDRIFRFFTEQTVGGAGNVMPPYTEYTKGHFQRGVE